MKKACPPDEMLADYLDNRLPDKERSEVERHLTICGTCLDGLVIAKGLVGRQGGEESDPVPTAVTEAAVRLVQARGFEGSQPLPERIRETVRNLVNGISSSLPLDSWRSWGLQPIRGPKRISVKDFVRLRRTFQDIDAEIEIERTGEHKAQIRVRVLEAEKLKHPVRVTLKQGDREVASSLAEQGSVLFEDTPFGHYSLTLTGDGLALGTFVFEIKESRRGRG
jgi:Putative zinc-finger